MVLMRINPKLFRVLSYIVTLQKNNESRCSGGFCCFRGGDLLGARTQDPNIKSVVLYQLS